MNYSAFELWAIILLLGIGTYLIRFSFLGLLGSRPMPDWVLRHLRYTAVGILPAMLTPLILWPSATGGETDPSRLAAAAAALALGYLTKNALWAMVGGMGALHLVALVT